MSETLEEHLLGSTPLLKLLRALQGRERGLLRGMILVVFILLFKLLLGFVGVELIASLYVPEIKKKTKELLSGEDRRGSVLGFK